MAKVGQFTAVAGGALVSAKAADGLRETAINECLNAGEGTDLVMTRNFVSVEISDTSASFPADPGSNSDISCAFFEEEQMLETKQSQ